MIKEQSRLWLQLGNLEQRAGINRLADKLTGRRMRTQSNSLCLKCPSVYCVSVSCQATPHRCHFHGRTLSSSSLCSWTFNSLKQCLDTRWQKSVQNTERHCLVIKLSQSGVHSKQQCLRQKLYDWINKRVKRTHEKWRINEWTTKRQAKEKKEE